MQIAETLTFEKVWAALMENKEQLKETREQIKETALRLKETDRIVRRNGRQMGDLHRKFGKLAEHLVAPRILERFNELGFHFGSVSPGGHKIFGENGKTKTEIDILLENRDTLLAVEVKVSVKATAT